MSHSEPLFLYSLLGLFLFGGGAHLTTSQPTSEASTPSTRTSDGLPVCEVSGKYPDGIYRIGRNVLAPVPRVTPSAMPSEEALRFVRDHHLSKLPVSLVGLTVDRKGKPRDICIVKELGYGLDKVAFDTVANYRFDPATFRGNPVPVRVTIEVNFPYYGE